MGAGQSTSSSPHARVQPPASALHVLRIAPRSPAASTDLEAWFDFILGVDVDGLDATADLERAVEENEGRLLELVVWSSKTRQTRLVPITPSRAWSATTSASTSKPSLLGLSMRICAPSHAQDAVWHVLDVLEGSPAESAGLVPYGDWIVGWSGGPLQREQDFYDVVEMHEEKPLRVYVYSYDFDTLREVVLVPNRVWGGAGLLGCVFGFGLLHRIPEPPPPEPATFRPSEEDEYDDREDEHMFVPADEFADAEFTFPGERSHDHEQEAGYAPGYPAVHDDWRDHPHPHSRGRITPSPPLALGRITPSPPPASALANIGSPFSFASHGRRGSMDLSTSPPSGTGVDVDGDDLESVDGDTETETETEDGDGTETEGSVE
ncbi:hypothetical protein EXIGLDRAFT_740610 [Exidia glandulosa HHB12029]|uniref:PDZ GRASP-type domain-containing protein n=1 Tax=Exidia glandulosa HHB12029 TaxID=1314781 RepID=A0A165GWU9_EXIGL|nr:hypothetical protein EXIGLDRAFT_740610 [Exidia glandulosa HHB12029]